MNERVSWFLELPQKVRGSAFALYWTGTGKHGGIPDLTQEFDYAAHWKSRREALKVRDADPMLSPFQPTRHSIEDVTRCDGCRVLCNSCTPTPFRGPQ